MKKQLPTIRLNVTIPLHEELDRTTLIVDSKGLWNV